MVQKEKRALATELRLQGKSYGEIMKTLNISSKGTLSYWFHDLKIPPQAKRRLRHNTELAYKRGLFTFNKKRTERIKNENKQILKQSAQEIPSLSNKELLLIGAALYWGEGANKEATRGYKSVSFTNTDPRMVKVFMKYLREVLKINDERIKPGIILHPNLDKDRAIQFWSRVTELPSDSFWISVGISKTSKRKRPSNTLPHGTAHIRVHKRQLFYRVRGHIQGIFDQLK